MNLRTKSVFACVAIVGCAALAASTDVSSAGTRQTSGAVQRINLAEALAAGKLRVVNRDVTRVEGRPDAIHVSERIDIGLVWIDGTDFSEGTIEVEVRGRDVLQRSFLGIAFHGKDNGSLEAVYVRPFNFRATDPIRHQHAVQYVSLPEFDWPRLRQEFPEEFENPVEASVEPTGWVPLRVVVKGQMVQIFVGSVSSPTLEIRKLGKLDRGMIGLWTGTTSDGDFANLRITPAK